MNTSQESLKDKLVLAAVQTLIFGILLAIFGFWLNLRLETYKKELIDDTERQKSALLVNAPLMQQRHTAYLEIQQTAQELNLVLEIHYYLAQQPLTGQVLTNQLAQVESDLNPTGGGGSSSKWVTHQDVIDALRELVFVRQKYEYISSENVNLTIDNFLVTIMDDLSQGEQPGNNTESFHTAARTRLKNALDQLNLTINEALQLDKLPIQ